MRGRRHDTAQWDQGATACVARRDLIPALGGAGARASSAPTRNEMMVPALRAVMFACPPIAFGFRYEPDRDRLRSISAENHRCEQLRGARRCGAKRIMAQAVRPK